MYSSQDAFTGYMVDCGLKMRKIFGFIYSWWVNNFSSYSFNSHRNIFNGVKLHGWDGKVIRK